MRWRLNTTQSVPGTRVCQISVYLSDYYFNESSNLKRYSPFTPPVTPLQVREIFLRLLEMGVVVVTTTNRELDELNRSGVLSPKMFQPLIDSMRKVRALRDSES